MDIINDVFEEFYEKLNDDEEIPNPVIDEVKKVLMSNNISSQELLNAIDKGCMNGRTN